MHTWWLHTVQKDNLQVPPTVRRQQREKRRLQRATQRQRSDPLATKDLNITQDEVDLESLTDEDQLAAKAPRAPAHMSGIAGANTDDSRKQTEQRPKSELELGITEETAAAKVNKSGQEGEPRRDQAANLAAGPRSRPPTLTPISTLQRHKRTWKELDIEEMADTAATEIGDLVEQDYIRSTNHKSGA
jgi:hypothetical protein